jgi:hypothetical protein
MDRGQALYDTRERTVTGHKFKIGQLVNYFGRDVPPAFIRSLSYCRQKAKHSSIASRTPSSPTSAWLRSTNFLARREL